MPLPADRHRQRLKALASAGALLALGCVATAAQVLVLRELLVAFQGNELLLGLFLGTWLLAEAAGTAVARRFSDGTAKPVEAFALLQVGLGLAPAAGIVLVRSFKAVMGIPTGELLGLPWAWLVAAGALAPAAVADGAAFPLGCRILALQQPARSPAGRAYCVCAAGSVLAGLLFLLPALYALSPLHLAALLFVTSVTAALGLLAAWQAARTLRRLGLGLLGAAALAVFASAERLETWSVRLQWYDHELVGTARSPYASMAVVRAAEQFTLFVNGGPYAVVPHPGPDVEILAHVPMLLHARPRRVLVAGRGAGGLLRELLQHPVEEIAYAEQDPVILEMLRRLPTPLTAGELTHPTVRTHPVEARLFLRRQPDRWDVILLNLPAPATLMLNRYYTVEFFQLAGERLAADGLLALALPGSEAALSPELAALNGAVHAALRTTFRQVRILPGDPTLFIASHGDALSGAWDPGVLGRRLLQRSIRAHLLREDYLRYRLDPGRFGGLARTIEAEEVANRDALPRATLASMRYLSRMASPGVARVLEGLDRVPRAAWATAAIALVAALLAAQLRSRRPLYLGYAAASTGFAGMLMAVVLILAFQVQYGDVYQYIALLTALFMLGAAAGSAWAGRRGGSPLAAIEALLLLAILAAYAAAAWGLRAEAWLGAIVLLMTVTGLSTGAQYSVLVARRMISDGRMAAAAGWIYVLDLLGAVLGAGLAGVVLIPTLGLGGTIFLAGTVKAGSLILIFAWAKQGGKQSRNARKRRRNAEGQKHQEGSASCSSPVQDLG